MNDKVSLIVPFYNSGKTIEKCILSILSQTYQNYEAILVNDGGVDNSEEIVKKYMAIDNRIKLINEGHGGVSYARNLGIKNATGYYIEFLDSDDYLEPTILQKMVETSKNHDADIVVCNYTHPSIKNYLGNKIIDATRKEELLKYYQTTFAAVVPWNKLYKKSLIKNYFDEEVAFCEDELFGLSNVFNASKIVGIDDVLYHYYVAPKDTSLEESSCINKMAKADDFWITKETYWYKRREILNKTKKILHNYLSEEDADDFAYARMFDFMIWELLIFNQIGVNKDGLILEMKNIFKEKEFIKSIDMRERYGLSYLVYQDDQLDEMVEKYVNLCIEAANNASENNLNIEPFYVCLNLFAKMFTKRNGLPLNTVDILAKAYYDIEENSSAEAKYVNALNI